MFSDTVLRLFEKAQNMDRMEEPDAEGGAGAPGEGPYMLMQLKLDTTDGGRIADACFQTYGCPAAIACGSWLTEWVKGKDQETAATITAADLAALLGGLPLGKEHCAELAVEALHKALRHTTTSSRLT